MQTTLVSITPKAEEFMAWAARVSSDNRENPEYAKLFKYMLDHGHWSPFEQAHASFEIVTSRAIAAQILRHRSFVFQERSQRYTDDITGFETTAGRRQAEKNRQSSTDDLDQATQDKWRAIQWHAFNDAHAAYRAALRLGICREQARMLLPLAVQTNLVMTGNIRSWIHYIELRTKPDTQEEHRVIAEAIRSQLAKELPVIASILKWN